LSFLPPFALAGNVVDMSRHVGDNTTCRSNFGQMGPCRRHKIEDVVAVCVGSSQHLPDFRNSYIEIYYGMGVHTHRLFNAHYFMVLLRSFHQPPRSFIR
jgi:hypothetical protein